MENDDFNGLIRPCLIMSETITMVAEKINLTPSGGKNHNPPSESKEKVGAAAAEEVPF